MGISGSGKTTVGRLLAGRLGWEFHDADDVHPPRNVAKMRRGHPLSERDRLPWLESLCQSITEWIAQERSVVLACSALTRGARTILGVDRVAVELFYLHGSRELLEARLGLRRGHYFPSTLLESQLRTLEEPEHAHCVDISPSPEQIVTGILRQLGLDPARPPVR